MRKLTIATCALAASLIAGCNASNLYTLNANTLEEDNSMTIATVNGTPITEQQATTALIKANKRNDVNFAMLSPAQREDLIKNMAIDLLIIENAKQRKLTENESVKQAITQTYQTVEQQILTDAMLKYVATQAIKDEAKINQLYQKMKTDIDGKDAVHVKHILVKTEEEAKKVIKALWKSSFEEMAKKVSIDNISKNNGGDLGTVKEELLQPSIKEAIAKLEVGKISTPVKSESGWHILKLEGRTKLKAASLEQAKPAIAQQLANQAIIEFKQQLLDNAKIEIVTEPKKVDDDKEGSI